jgi:hypothetical protein
MSEFYQSPSIKDRREVTDGQMNDRELQKTNAALKEKAKDARSDVKQALKKEVMDDRQRSAARMENMAKREAPTDRRELKKNETKGEVKDHDLVSNESRARAQPPSQPLSEGYDAGDSRTVGEIKKVDYSKNKTMMKSKL